MIQRKLKIKEGDQVEVFAGRNRKKQGKIIKVIPAKERVVIEGVNLRKKHVRPKRADRKGETVEIPAPLPVANVRLICPSCSKPTRIGYKVEGKNKTRICKKCQSKI